MMLRAYKYRLYPTEEQKRQIDQAIGCCRFIYNLALETKIWVYKTQGLNLSAYDLQKQLTDLKKEHSWLKETDSQALNSTILKIDVAFKYFFKRGGYPKFKSKKNSGSFSCSTNVRKVDFDKFLLTIPKLQNIPIVLSRKFEGQIKTITITRTATGKYYASILVKNAVEEIKPPKPTNAVGIDLGIKDFAVLSTGEKIANPRYLKESQNRLKTLERRASKKKKGSNNRKKANLKVAILHEKISNQRNDFLHKVSTRLISDSQTDTICVETLAVKNMVRNHNLAQSISDASWSEFVRQLEYKAKWYGKNLIKISQWQATSKTCSNCGHKYQELNLSEREWTCSNCNAIHDRDINAAINIKNSGVGSSVASVEKRSIERSKKRKYIQDKTFM